MIPVPIKSMIISGLIIIVTMIILSIFFNISEKRLRKEELIEELMIKLKIPKRDIEKVFENKSNYGISKIEINENSIWDLYVRKVLQCDTIDYYINNEIPDKIEKYKQLIQYLSNRNNKSHLVLLRSYRKLLWLIEDTKIRNKDKELIQKKIIKDIKCIFALFECLNENKNKSMKIRLEKNTICNLNLDSYPLFIDNILKQMSLCN